MASFGIEALELSQFFIPDNINSGRSIAKLRGKGGLDGIEGMLKTNLKKGISKDAKEHVSRINQFGENHAIVKPPKTILQLIIDNFQDQMLRILCAAALVSLVLGVLKEGWLEGWLEGASILIAVLIIVTVTSGNNYAKELQFQKLNAISESKNINVIRSGLAVNMAVHNLLVGDMVEVEAGQIISVDGILVQCNNLKVDESSITGQTREVRKSIPNDSDLQEEANPFLISSSKVTEGTGLMVVLAIGRNCYYGKMKVKIQQETDQTPLQIKLQVLAAKIGKVGIFSATATFLTMVIHYLYDCHVQDEPFLETLFRVETLHEIIEYFIISVSIVVVAVPQGLPLSVTIALAYSVGKMKQQNNLVRYLQACETMGGVDNICSDKTGTLTRNSMTVTKIFIEAKTYEVIAREIVTPNTASLMCVSICNNSTATPKIQDLNGNYMSVEQIGNKTQCALIEMAHKMGFDYKRFRVKENIIKVFPFNSERKKMATVYKDQSGKKFVFVKGAPDFLIPYCKSYLNKEGKAAKINDDFLQKYEEEMCQFTSQSLRAILLAFKQVEKIPKDWDDIERNLVFLGLAGIKDPLRDQITEAIQACTEAGVKVRMVTGDNKKTAIAIAKEAGILSADWQESDSDCTVMEGGEFRDFVGGLINQGTPEETVGDMDNFKKVRDQLCVLARCSPDDKYLLATGLKKLDHVVAMTGDGLNDAPALKKADIGFSMGIAGTEVAKEASGIILLDDNFNSIVTAMKWGRNIFDSIRKFLQFQLTVNFVALVMVFVGGAILRESPLNPIQMLWVNLIMDTLASLALATEPPSEALLKRTPYAKRQDLITKDMWTFIIIQGFFQILILGIILFKGPDILGIACSIGVHQWNQETGKHYSIFFNVFVFLQVFNEINARKLKKTEINVFQNFFNNWMFLAILIGTIAIQLVMISFGGKSLKTVQLTFKQNLLCILLGSTSLLTCLLYKMFLPQKFIFSVNGIEINSYKLYWRSPSIEKMQ